MGAWHPTSATAPAEVLALLVLVRLVISATQSGDRDSGSGVGKMVQLCVAWGLSASLHLTSGVRTRPKRPGGLWDSQPEGHTTSLTPRPTLNPHSSVSTLTVNVQGPRKSR